MQTELKMIRGVCPHDCPDTCGMKIEVQGQKAISIRGDSEHPFTHGFLCQKVSRYLERVYHPERLLFPKRRVGSKGEGKYVQITWEEAIAEISQKFREVIESPSGPQSILPYSYSGTLGKIQGASLDRRLFHRLGASLLDRTICATAGAVGCDMTLGTRAVIDPEAIIHRRYIINWGSNTSVTNSHLWRIMLQARKLGAKIVTIDPHESSTAKRSDWWIPIRPGTDAALALGMMHILFRDGLVDQDYLERYCLGTAELRERVLNEYSPNVVSKITGIPVESIEKLASEYAFSNRDRGGPSIIRLNYGLQRHGGGGMAVRVITCLPAVIGSWRFAGGGALLSTSKMVPWNNSELERTDLIPPGTRIINMVRLAEALVEPLDPPIKILYVYNANPATVNPDQQKVIRGLLREDLFTVVHDQFQTDTANYADLVLPATTQLEHFDIHNGYGHYYIQANLPAIPALGESKANTEVFRLLAKAMQLEDEIFQKTDLELAEIALSPISSPTMYPPKEGFDGITLDRLLEGGPVRLNFPKDHAPFAEGKFGTPSGKCEFYSTRMADLGHDPLPSYTPPHEDPQTKPILASQFPLQMVCPPEPAFLNSTFVNIDGLRQSMKGPRVEISTQDAEAREIHQGDWVEVFNKRGSFYAKALVGETVSPGVVATFGTWWSRYIPFGANCNSTTSTGLTDLGGGATFFDNLVEVRCAKDQRIGFMEF